MSVLGFRVLGFRVLGFGFRCCRLGFFWIRGFGVCREVLNRSSAGSAPANVFRGVSNVMEGFRRFRVLGCWVQGWGLGFRPKC